MNLIILLTHSISENCAILEDFVKMYNRDKIKYKCLKPCQLDDSGKSLDEIISNEPETSLKWKVIEILKVKLIYEDKSNELYDHFLFDASVTWCLNYFLV